MKTTALNWIKGGDVQTIAQLAEKEMNLAAQIESKTLELQTAERSAGEAFLNGDGDAGVDVVVRLRVQIESIGRAVGAVRARRQEVILAGFKAQSKQSRAAADAKKSELDTLTGKSAKLLAQLAELEGVDDGKFLPSTQQALRSSRLRQEIGELERKADEIEASPVLDRGAFDVDGVFDNEAIVQGILSHESAGPTCAEIRAWIAAVEDEARSRNKFSDDFQKLPRRVSVKWTEGKITDAYIFVPSLADSRISNLDAATSGFDISSSTFRG